MLDDVRFFLRENGELVAGMALIVIAVDIMIHVLGHVALRAWGQRRKKHRALPRSGEEGP